MPQLRASEHYVWSESDVLGRGATGEVYKARNKATGEVYAVKSSNHMGIMRPVQIQRRELDVLCKLDHKNIVQLLAIEEDVSTKTKVIVMELCTGGSLYTILDEPQNAYGLEEEEFLRVLFDVASGMQYLRSRDIVHRDIKPGNIMKCFTEDGRSVYKLTDFGAARELENEEQFMSLYGTEEYLDPDMYERAVMNIHTGKQFAATVDLWSLGVTFYHVATGHLPFRPLGGRRNKDMMYKITQQKDSGVISGVQETEAGVIRWSNVLPETSPLSVGLKNLVTPMLASLLENDNALRWGFDRFFEEVRCIREKISVTVFHVCALRIMKIYIDPQDSLSQLQEMVAEQTGIRASQQLLLFENMYLSDIVTPLQFVNTYPQTSDDKPVYLFPKQTTECSPIDQPQVDQLPTFSSVVYVENDAVVSRLCCGILHSISRHIEGNCVSRVLLSKACKLLVQLFNLEVNHLQEYVDHVDMVAMEIGKRVDCLCTNHSLCLKWCGLLMAKQLTPHENQTDVMRALQQQHTQLISVIEETKQDMDRFSQKKDSRSSYCLDELLEDENKRKGQIGILLNNVAEITDLFKKDRLHRRLTFNEEQIHKFEKTRLQSVCVKAWSVYEHSNQQMRQLHNQLIEWLRGVQDMMRQHQELETAVTQTLQQLHHFTAQLDQTTHEYIAQQKELLSNMEQVNTGKQQSPKLKSSSQRDKKKKMLQSLQADLALLTNDTVEIRKAMQENQEVLNTIKLMNEMEGDIEDTEFEMIHVDESSSASQIKQGRK